MTHRPVKILEDGSRQYADYHRYTPVAEADRKYGRNRPDDPRAVRFHGKWFLPLDLLPEDQREVPATRPFRDARGA